MLAPVKRSAGTSDTLYVLKGASKDQERAVAITIVEPNGGFITKFSGVNHERDTWSTGFLGNIHITPTDVSFYNLSFLEGAVAPHSEGWLLGYPQSHPQSVSWVRIDSTNEVGRQDEIFTGRKDPPFGQGLWYWDIPWYVGTNSLRVIRLPDAQQLSTSDSNGKAVISKGGKIVSSLAADSTTGY